VVVPEISKLEMEEPHAVGITLRAVAA